MIFFLSDIIHGTIGWGFDKGTLLPGRGAYLLVCQFEQFSPKLNLIYLDGDIKVVGSCGLFVVFVCVCVGGVAFLFDSK